MLRKHFQVAQPTCQYCIVLNIGPARGPPAQARARPGNAWLWVRDCFPVYFLNGRLPRHINYKAFSS